MVPLLLLALAAAPVRAEEPDGLPVEGLSQVTPYSTTKEEVLRRLGPPTATRKFIFRKDAERWVYFKPAPGIPRGRVIRVDFRGEVVTQARLLADRVEERPGFVLGGSLGWAYARGSGTQRYRMGGGGGGFELGWAFHERFAVLLGGMGTSHGEGGASVGGFGARFFPVIPWYVQAAYGGASDKIEVSGRHHKVEGRGWVFQAGREFVLNRALALAPEVFYGRLHALKPGDTLPPGAAVNERSSFLGAALKLVWYP